MENLYYENSFLMLSVCFVCLIFIMLALNFIVAIACKSYLSGWRSDRVKTNQGLARSLIYKPFLLGFTSNFV